MSNRHSVRLQNAQKEKVSAKQRWVKNVLLVDIRKVGLFPPDCGSETVSEEKSRGCENISEDLATVTERHFSESMEEYVNVARLCKCFMGGCSFKANTFVTLFYHVLSSHKELNTFSCTFCSHVCPLSGMVEHLTMHGPSMFQCKYCSYHHFSQLKVSEHIKSKHVGCPSVVVELRDFKEEEGCDTSDDEEVEIIECMDDEVVILKEEPSDSKNHGEAEALESSKFYADERDSSSIKISNSSCSDMSSEAVGLKASECNESLNELDKLDSESKSVEEINRCGDMGSSKGETEHSEGNSVNTFKRKTSLPANSLMLFYGPLTEDKQKKVNLQSTTHNYHSSELHLRKNALEKNWQCGLCDFVGLYNNMIAHAESAHDVKYQFKCSRCSIFIASRGYVESHCMIFHPNTLVTLIAYYFLPGSSLPFREVKINLPDGQEIFSPDKPVFSNKIPVVYL